MPRIPQYEQQTRASGAGLGPGPTEEPSGTGRAVATFAGQLEGIQQDQFALRRFEQQKADERAAVWANEQVTQTRARWIEELPKRQAAASETAEGFTPALLKDFDDDANERIKAAPTENSRNWLKDRLAQSRIALQQDALGFEAKRGVEYKVNGLARAIDGARTSAEFNPQSFGAITAEQLAAIQASGLPADVQHELGQKAVDALAVSSVQGMIRKDPHAALKALNTEKSDNLAVNKLTSDARLQLRNAAESEIRQRDIEARQAQSEARAQLTDRVRDASAAYRLGLDFDNPPSRAEFITALGKDGDKAYESFTHEQRLGSDLKSLAQMSDPEQTKLLETRKPSGTEGVAEEAQRYQVLATRTDHLRKLREADPANFVASYNPRIQAAWQSAQTPEGADQYARATLAEQQRLGVANPRILPDEQASSIAHAFDGKNGEAIVGLIQTEAQRWGSNWPQVYGELAAKKMPAAAQAIGRGMDPGAAARLASVAAMPMQELQKGVADPPADIRAKITESMAPFQQSLDGVIGAENTFAGMYEATERLAYSYIRQGQSVAKATTQAYNEVLGDHYRYREVNNRTFRVPAQEDSQKVEGGAQSALERVPGGELEPPVATATGNESEALADLTRTIARRGYWVTSADGENGLTLFLDGAPVLRKGGAPYSLTWDQLRGTYDSARAEAAKRAQERTAAGTAGLR
jgi:hypothetical protein